MCFQSIKGGFPLTFRGLSPARLLSRSRVPRWVWVGATAVRTPAAASAAGQLAPLIATLKVYAAVKGVAHDATSGGADNGE